MICSLKASDWNLGVILLKGHTHIDTQTDTHTQVCTEIATYRPNSLEATLFRKVYRNGKKTGPATVIHKQNPKV